MITLNIFLLLLKFSIFACAGLMSSKMVQLLRLDGICQGKIVPMKSYHLGFTNDPKSIFIANTTLIAARDLEDSIKLTLTLNRCRSRENPDTCEEFSKYKNLDFCSSINPDNILASQNPFYVAYKPKLKCPIKKGTYVALNTTINTGYAFSFTMVDSWYWRAKFELYSPDDHKLVYCLNIEAQVVPVSKTKHR